MTKTQPETSTKQDILEYLLKQGQATAQNLAQALDISPQAIRRHLKDLQEELGLSYLFIAHDLAVVRHMSDDIIVMNRGRVVESGPADDLCERPQHDYTRKLLASIPA